MKRLFFALLIFVFSLSSQIATTGAYFSDEETIQGITISAGCWTAPTKPELVYPENNYVANIGSPWLANPYMDWTDSTGCPGTTITYQYESYRDEGLTSLAYRSGPLSISQIPAPGTPDGTYYWRARAFDGANWSDWSDVWLLTVDRSNPNPPLPPPPPPAPIVVINEIMWMGSKSHSSDEWIELRNTTNSTIDLSGWVIENAAQSHGSLTIPTGKSIGPNGYFLIANYSASSGSSSLNVEADWTTTSISLNDSYVANGQLILKNSSAVTIDETNPAPVNAKWPAGVHEDVEQSMERNDDPSTGWHSCDSDGCKATTYWDSPNTANYGTPKAQNLSEDPSEINLEFFMTDSTHVGFTLEGPGLPNFEKASYTITYDSDQTKQGIVGSVDIDGKTELTVSKQYLGFCSSGGTCAPYTGVKNINIEVKLSGASEKVLTSTID